ncbi:MAG: corrinoid protein [Phycisphaerales bacterium]|nr:MAG: corrinoid protein [Phycisphaerales bacterium]
MSITERIATAVLTGADDQARQLVEEALASEISAVVILEEGLLEGMAGVSRRFREGEYFLPEVLVAADALKACMDVLQPRMIAENVRPRATSVIGTVRGDLHDIGKNLLGTMLQGAGFEVIDLGVDVSAEAFIDACRAQCAHVVGLSALLTTTMPQMEVIVREIRAALNPAPAIIIGGAPVTEDYARHIGADGYGPDAATGAELAKQLCLGTA